MKILSEKTVNILTWYIEKPQFWYPRLRPGDADYQQIIDNWQDGQRVDPEDRHALTPKTVKISEMIGRIKRALNTDDQRYLQIALLPLLWPERIDKRIRAVARASYSTGIYSYDSAHDAVDQLRFFCTDVYYTPPEESCAGNLPAITVKPWQITASELRDVIAEFDRIISGDTDDYGASCLQDLVIGGVLWQNVGTATRFSKSGETIILGAESGGQPLDNYSVASDLKRLRYHNIDYHSVTVDSVNQYYNWFTRNYQQRRLWGARIVITDTAKILIGSDFYNGRYIKLLDGFNDEIDRAQVIDTAEFTGGRLQKITDYPEIERQIQRIRDDNPEFSWVPVVDKSKPLNQQLIPAGQPLLTAG